MSDVNNEHVEMKVVSDGLSMDLPNVNNAYRGSEYRYAYATGDSKAGVWWDNLVKVDMQTGAVLTWQKDNHWPTEPIFVADPNSAREDDGVVMSIVLGVDDATKPYSYLLVLNATDFTELATAVMPVALPYTSHGFFDAKQ